MIIDDEPASDSSCSTDIADKPVLQGAVPSGPQCYCKCIPFMVNYFFLCKGCSPAGQESFTQRQANFSQMCVTVLANLTFERKSEKEAQTGRLIFSKERMKDNEIFYHHPDQAGQTTDDMFGLLESDLGRIGPNYDQLCNAKGHKGQGEGSSLNKLSATFASASLATSSVQNGSTGSSQGPRTKSAKRKGESQNVQTVSKKAKMDSSSTKMSIFGFPVEHPYNKDGYRYYLAESDPHAPNRQEFDESNDYAGKPIPSYLYRVIRPDTALLSAHDRAPQLKLFEERLCVTGEKGYSVVRGTHGVTSGCWYYEFTILDQPEGSHCRVGWSQALGLLQAPVGYDKFSYAYRSRKGTRFHESTGKHYGEAYRPGDTIGVLIDMPTPHALPGTLKDLPLVKFKNQFYYEEKDEVQKAVKQLTPLQNSNIEFFKNGVSQGVAFSNIYTGEYFPALSLYKNITLGVNFGPGLRFPPRGRRFRPLSAKTDEFLVEQCVADLLFFVENEGRLTLDN